MIPEAAVEAAARTLTAEVYGVDLFDGMSDDAQDTLRRRATLLLEAAAPHMPRTVTDEAFGYAVSAIRGHGEFTTAEAEAAVQDIIEALRPTP